ncbi:MAG: nucleoside hydrolase-like domain-containing protein [Pirellulaceae bacterium]
MRASLFICLLSFIYWMATPAGVAVGATITKVSIPDGKWHINGTVTYRGAPAEGLLMNVRMVNAVFEDAGDAIRDKTFDADANTDELIARIPDYVAHGVRAFTICLQGGWPGYEGAVNSAFNPDGSLRESYLQRVTRVIEACDRSGAVVILGCYYQRQDQVLKDEAAVRAGIVNVAKWVTERGFTDVVLEIANEYAHAGFDHTILKSATGEAELIALAKKTAPGLLVATSGLGDGELPDEAARVGDFLLIHFNNTPLDRIPGRIAALKKHGKPIVCNEDDKRGADGAKAAELCVAGGASWGLMLVDRNQHFPFEFQGPADDVVVYANFKNLTTPPTAEPRLRIIVETDAGGDPDDEQSLVRFLLYANEWDVEGIICNRPQARDGENLNPERTGLGIVQRMVDAYGACYPNLVQHDARYPRPQQLLQRTVSGYEDSDDGVKLILAAVDLDDPRPVWFMNWGTDHGSDPSSLKRALDRVLKERGPAGYAAFKNRLRLSGDDQFGDHTTRIDPPFPIWIDTLRPELDGRRWYHRFSAITGSAGGFDLQRDVLAGHGPLGALYPTNTGPPQKEGDTMMFLYLIPTGMNDPEQPTWGSWAGRYGPNPSHKDRPYYWANQADDWQGSTHRENTLKRWAVHFQNDFRARLDWCVKSVDEANHPPVPLVEGELHRTVVPGERISLDAGSSTDADRDDLEFAWMFYPESGSYVGALPPLTARASPRTSFVAPEVDAARTIHLIVAVSDKGSPPLTRYRRVIVTIEPEASDAESPADADAYFPPSESQGGWRLLERPDDIRRIAGMAPDKLVELKQWLLESDTRDFAAVVIRNGYIVLEVERGNSAKTDSRRVASVSKAICATVLAIASERSQSGQTPRRMTFDDAAFDFIPWAQPLSDQRKVNITVQQLFNHTSGICPEATGAKNDGSWEYVLGLSGDERTTKLAFDPGTGCGYSTHALSHAALVCETVTGKPYDEFAIESLFQPIGCEQWWFQYYDGGEKIGRHPSHGMGMPARDLARIAYCMLHEGRWGDRQIIPQWFVRETAAPTHNVNSPEMRWKLNPRVFSHGWELPARHWPESKRPIDGIPADARYKPGSGGQLIAFVPSLDLVITRQTGGSGEWQYEDYLRRACAAVLRQ